MTQGLIQKCQLKVTFGLLGLAYVTQIFPAHFLCGIRGITTSPTLGLGILAKTGITFIKQAGLSMSNSTIQLPTDPRYPVAQGGWRSFPHRQGDVVITKAHKSHIGNRPGWGVIPFVTTQGLVQKCQLKVTGFPRPCLCGKDLPSAFPMWDSGYKTKHLVWCLHFSRKSSTLK